MVVKFPVPSAATVRTSLGSYLLPELSRIRRSFLDIHVGTAKRRRFVPPFGAPGFEITERELLTYLYVLVKEFTRAGFIGPEAESKPSKHVFLFVRAALR